MNLLSSLRYLIEAVDHAKPASVKGVFIKSVYLSTTMGVGVKVAI
jgi:ribosomal protein L1